MTERSRRYEARHPELTYYTSKKRSAKSFVVCNTEKFVGRLTTLAVTDTAVTCLSCGK